MTAPYEANKQLYTIVIQRRVVSQRSRTFYENFESVRRQSVRRQETKTGHFQQFPSYEAVAGARKAQFTMLVRVLVVLFCFCSDSMLSKELSHCHPRLASLRARKRAYGSDRRERVRLDPQLI